MGGAELVSQASTVHRCASQIPSVLSCVSQMSQSFVCLQSCPGRFPVPCGFFPHTRGSNYTRSVFVDVACFLGEVAKISSLRSWISFITCASKTPKVRANPQTKKCVYPGPGVRCFMCTSLRGFALRSRFFVTHWCPSHYCAAQ
jgi:hypothetical protein